MKLAGIRAASRVAVAHRPVSPTYLAGLPVIDRAHAAPDVTQSWSQLRDTLLAIATADGKPVDRYLMVGDTMLEGEWAEAARMAGYMTAGQFFAPHAGLTT